MRRERVSSLSTGWRQRVALGTAIVHRPRLLFLDEPTSGVDPTARRAFWDLIYNVVEQGVTALVTTHYMDEAEYCGRVGIMRDGRLLAMDTPTRLKETALPGVAWNIYLDIQQPEMLLRGLGALQVLRRVACAPGWQGRHCVRSPARKGTRISCGGRWMRRGCRLEASNAPRRAWKTSFWHWRTAINVINSINSYEKSIELSKISI